MAAILLDKILKLGRTTTATAGQTAKAHKWYREQALKTTTTGSALFREAGSSILQTTLEIGRMYIFRYDPKLKQTLPYYDRYPAVIAFKSTKLGFLGLNLHYLPIRPRAALLNALHTTASNMRYDSSTKMKITYATLQSASKFKYFQPCVKSYLYSHVQTRFLEIQSEQWDIAAFLPVADFQKASVETVWRESMKGI